MTHWTSVSEACRSPAMVLIATFTIVVSSSPATAPTIMTAASLRTAGSILASLTAAVEIIRAVIHPARRAGPATDR